MGTLVKPAKRMKVGSVVSFGDGRLKATVVEELDQGGRIIEFSYEGVFLEVLESLGEMPLPPYIKERLEDKRTLPNSVCKRKWICSSTNCWIVTLQKS